MRAQATVRIAAPGQVVLGDTKVVVESDPGSKQLRKNSLIVPA